MEAEEVHNKVSQLLDEHTEVGEYMVTDVEDSRRVEYKWAGDALYHILRVGVGEEYMSVTFDAWRRIDFAVVLRCSEQEQDGFTIDTTDSDSSAVWNAVSEMIDQAVGISLDDMRVRYEKTGVTTRLIGHAEAFDVDDLDVDTASVREAVGYEPEKEGLDLEWDEETGGEEF